MNRSSFSRLMIAALSMVAAFTPGAAKAQHLGNDTIALFPKNIGEFAYANLKQARSQKWFPQLQEQMLPERFRQFEKFLASAGVDPNSQVEELAWGLVGEGLSQRDGQKADSGDAVPTGEQVVGIALGNYNPESTEAYFKRQKLPTVKAR